MSTGNKWKRLPAGILRSATAALLVVLCGELGFLASCSAPGSSPVTLRRTAGGDWVREGADKSKVA
jgi:hypothetical protein